MEKTLEELKFVMNQRKIDFKDQPELANDPGLVSSLLALCLSSRKNMCIHPTVSQEEDRSSVDSECRRLTSPWNRMAVKSQANDIEDIHKKSCIFFENF